MRCIDAGSRNALTGSLPYRRLFEASDLGLSHDSPLCSTHPPTLCTADFQAPPSYSAIESNQHRRHELGHEHRPHSMVVDSITGKDLEFITEYDNDENSQPLGISAQKQLAAHRPQSLPTRRTFAANPTWEEVRLTPWCQASLSSLASFRCASSPTRLVM